MTIADLVQSQLTTAMAKDLKGDSAGPAASSAPDCSLYAPQGEAPTTDDEPNAELLAKLNDLPIFDAQGVSHSFRSVYTCANDDDSGTVDRNLVIILRHIFCANCQEYVRHLAKELPPTALPAGTRITLVTHGAPELLPHYIKETNSPYPLYTDPTQKLHQTLGLAKTLALGKKPNYIKISFSKLVVSGIVQGLSTKKHALKGGDSWQVGGEFLFVKDGGDWKVTWGHRMKTTRDHAEVEVIKEVLGVSGPPAKDSKSTEPTTVNATTQSNGETQAEKVNGTTVNGAEKEKPATAVPQNGTPIQT